MNQQQSQPINISPEDTTPVICTKCPSQFFIPVYMIRKVSAIISPSGKEEMIQVPVMACAACGTPNVPEGFEDEVTEGETEGTEPVVEGSTIIAP